MDGFGGDNFDQADVDPAAEFLAREKDQLAGIVDDVIPPASESGTGDDATANSGERVKYFIWTHLQIAVSDDKFNLMLPCYRNEIRLPCLGGVWDVHNVIGNS